MSNDNLHIRDYAAPDKPALLGLLQKNIPGYFAQSELADLATYLDHETEQYFVAEINGEVIAAGGLNFKDDHRTGVISWDFVDPEFQGKGVGKKLLSYRMDLLRNMTNVTRIIVRTTQKSYRFYEKNGFELRYVVKDYWEEGFDLFFMEFTEGQEVRAE